MDGETGQAAYRLTDNLNGGCTSDLVDLAYCVNIFCDIYDIATSIQIISAAIIAMSVGGSVIGGVMLVCGVVSLSCAVMSYADNVDLMCQYSQGNESAGNQIIFNAGVNIIAGVVSYGINSALKEYAIPAIQNKVAREYGEEFVESLVPDAVIYPDGTIEALYNCGEYALDISDIMTDNPGFDIVVTNYTDGILSISGKYGMDVLSKSAAEIVTYGQSSIDLVFEYGKPAVDAIAVNGDKFIEAYVNDNKDTINAMLSESEIINNLIADIKTGEKGSLYTDSILTIPSQYLTEEYIGKIAKATSVKLANMVKNGDIIKTTGGKISSQVVTVAIDNKTGKVYYGLSNPLNNPTHNTTTHKVLKELIDNAVTPPIAYRGRNKFIKANTSVKSIRIANSQIDGQLEIN